ncbi:pirin family protein [Saccharicrinis aurantiacus]|uniref:pirin family protein n=1 Tax=Saccharicrinis aurantiacus TaxID=1849719 RepID=UPI002490EBE4|nr:pirin family protein [Saccharicrinis aurantiacus]
MKTVIHKSDSRGFANHGWLEARHSFSFANYYNPDKLSFGALRVLNDDIIAPSAGFPQHPHDNMEIITIPLSGAIAHKDSMGNSSVIKTGEIQVMSAGKGIFHSEYNYNKDQELNLFQIWIIPNVKNIVPRYDQLNLDDILKQNELIQILSPNKDDKGVWIYQDAWFHLGDYNKEASAEYTLKNKKNGVYIMMIEGEVSINDTKLVAKDAMGIWDSTAVNINIKPASKFLIIEVPMELN